VARVIEAGGHPACGDVVTILATTALRIREVSGLRVGDVDLERGLLQVSRQTYPGRGGLVTKQTKGRRRRTVPVIEPLRPTLARLTVDRDPEERLVTGPRAASSPRRRCGTPPAGTSSSPTSAFPASSGTACGTRPSPGWPTRESSCTSCSGWPGTGTRP
jgi:integrase